MQELITLSIHRNTIKHFCFHEETNTETSFFAVYEYITDERTQEIKSAKKGTYKTKDFKQDGKYNFYFFDKTEQMKVQLFVKLLCISEKEFTFLLCKNNLFETNRATKRVTDLIKNNRFVASFGDNTFIFLNACKEKTHIEKFDTSLIKAGDTLKFEYQEQLKEIINKRFCQLKKRVDVTQRLLDFRAKEYEYELCTGSKSYSDIVYKVTYSYLVEEITNDTIELKSIDDAI